MSQQFVPKDGFRPLTRAEVEAELQKIDMAPSATIMRRADQLSGDLNIEGRDLLQSAIVGALTSRSCRTGIDGGQFLAGIMRSIASTTRRARERRGEVAAVLPVDVLTEQLAVGRYTAMTAGHSGDRASPPAL